MPFYLYNPGAHKIVPEELRNLNIEIISPVLDVDEDNRTIQEYMDSMAQPGFDAVFEFYGGWEHNSIFGVHAFSTRQTRESTILDPNKDWDGFSLTASALERWYPLWSEEAVRKIRKSLAPYPKSLALKDYITRDFFFDNDLRGPMFVLLASYLTEKPRAAYYEVATKAGFISQDTYKQIMRLIHSKPEKTEVDSSQAIAVPPNITAKTLQITRTFTKLLEKLKKNHQRLEQKYSDSEFSSTVKTSANLLTDLEKAQNALSTQHDNRQLFYSQCKAAIDKAKDCFNQQRASLFVRFLTILTQFITRLIRPYDNNKYQFFDGTKTTTQSADVLYAFKTGLDSLEEESNRCDSPKLSMD